MFYHMQTNYYLLSTIVRGGMAERFCLRCGLELAVAPGNALLRRILSLDPGGG